MTELRRTTTLEGVVLACKMQRQKLGLPQIVVDEMSGMQLGYCGKLECGDKGLGKITLPLILGALGLSLAVVPGPTQHRDENAETLRRKRVMWGRRGREKQLLMQSPRKRRAIARAGARARWKASPEENHDA